MKICPLLGQVVDLVADDSTKKYTCLTKKYKVVIDKGTYDAISLIPEDEMAARTAYLRTVKQVVSDDGLFVITSCNWTEEQLLQFWETGTNGSGKLVRMVRMVLGNRYEWFWETGTNGSWKQV
jgi:hypothetical protein